MFACNFSKNGDNIASQSIYSINHIVYNVYALNNIHLTRISQNDILDRGVLEEIFVSDNTEKIQTPLWLEMLRNGWKQYERWENNWQKRWRNSRHKIRWKRRHFVTLKRISYMHIHNFTRNTSYDLESSEVLLSNIVPSWQLLCGKLSILSTLTTLHHYSQTTCST